MSRYFISIILMSIVTQVPRLIPAVTRMSQIKNPKLNRFLDCVPLAALGALIFPGVLDIGNTKFIGIVSISFSLFLAIKKVNVMVNIVLSSLLTSLIIYISSIL